MNATQTQATAQTSLRSPLKRVTISLLITWLSAGCFVSTNSDDRYSDSYRDETYVEDDVIIDDEVAVDETFVDEEEQVSEEMTEEVTEEEEETTTTTTTTVETPPTPEVEAVTCSPDDQGFADAPLVDAFVVVLAEGCEWRETSDDITPDMGLGFIDVEDDEDYAALFDCGDQSVNADVDWENEVVVYLSGWVPAGSDPEFQWAVGGPDDEIVLGLVSQQVCSDESEFYQGAFIAPRRAERPRVISCTEPTECD